LKWREIFSYGKDILSAISNLADDQDFRNNLGKAGGLLSLISIALEVTNKVYDESQPPKVKAYNRLSKYVLKITKKLLKDMKPENEIDKGMIEKQINSSFQNASDEFELNNWDSYLPNHPVIQKFRKGIITYLRNTNTNYEELLGRIDSELIRNASSDEDYEYFYDWWEGQRRYQDRIDYLRLIEKQSNDTFDIPDNKPLQEYYIPNSALQDISIDTLNKDDELLVNSYPSKEILEVIHDFVIGGEKIMIIAGSFGMGKTSAVKMASSKYASKCLNTDSENSFHPPIPIPISLKNSGFYTEDKERSLDSILNDIISPGNSNEEKRTPLLIIFDALEKHKDPITVHEELEELRRNGYSNTKVVITTNLDERILYNQRINIKKYTRLLPFSDTQLNDFFARFKVKAEGQSLKCDRGIAYGLPVQEMFRPLFAWIFSYLETSETGVKIVEKEGWTPQMKKAWIYMLFFHRIIAGRPREAFTNTGWKDSYLQPKRILRAVAVLKQIHQLPHRKSIPVESVEKEIKNFEIRSGDLDITAFQQSYFISFHYHGDRGNSINFVHGSFSDYLVAEFYIESMLNNKSLPLNTGIPNKETVEFLEGLIGLLDTSDNDVEDFISASEDSSDKTSLLTSFNYNNGRKVAKEELISASEAMIEKEFVIFPLLENREEKQRIWMNLEGIPNDFSQLWIRRWISLFVMNKLSVEDDDKRYPLKKHKDAIKDLIKYSGSFVPGYLKSLRDADLSHTDLSRTNLFGADLTHANLSDANLLRADLTHANLSDANLSSADLTDVNMSDANLSSANLSDSTLFRANLDNCIFSHANLSNTKFVYSILSYANFLRANLSSTNLSYANLSDANLCGSTIVDADLSYANLSDANLSYGFIKGRSKYDNLICNAADFNAASIDDEKLLIYLKNSHAINVPQSIAKECKDTISPKIHSVSPHPDCKDIPVWSYITANFSDTLDNSSVNPLTFALYNNEYPVDVKVSLISQGKTAVLIPLFPLSPDAIYTVAINSEVKDLVGNKMDTDANWQFTTGEATSNKLAILGISASGDDGNVPQNAIDNDLNTRWTNHGVGSWIQLDLGELKNVSDVQIAWFKGNRRAYNFEIALYDKIDSLMKKFYYKSKGEDLLPESYKIGNIKARYLRIAVNGNSQNNWASISEIITIG
jgi:hypothetical protein